MITIQIKKKHIKGQSFYDNENCALALATQEALNDNTISVGTSFAFKTEDNERTPIGTIEPSYHSMDFSEDCYRAVDIQDPEEVLRELTYTPN